MPDKAQLEAQLEIAKLQEAYEAIRPKAEDPKRTQEVLDEYHAAGNELAAAVTAYKEKYPPSGPVGISDEEGSE
jgi:hypothetical protein